MIALLFCCVVNGWLALFGCLVDCVLVVFVFGCFFVGFKFVYCWLFLCDCL